MGEYDSAVNCSVDYAAEIGADAVGFTLYGGSNHEVEMAEFRNVQEDAREHDLPVVMWSYPAARASKRYQARGHLLCDSPRPRVRC